MTVQSESLACTGVLPVREDDHPCGNRELATTRATTSIKCLYYSFSSSHRGTYRRSSFFIIKFIVGNYNGPLLFSFRRPFDATMSIKKFWNDKLDQGWFQIDLSIFFIVYNRDIRFYVFVERKFWWLLRGTSVYVAVAPETSTRQTSGGGRGSSGRERRHSIFLLQGTPLIFSIEGSWVLLGTHRTSVCTPPLPLSQLPLTRIPACCSDV